MAKYLNPEDATQEAAIKSANSGTDDMIGTVNDKHKKTMEALAEKSAAARAERDRLRRNRHTVAVLKVIGSLAACGLLVYAWIAYLADSVVVAPLLILFAFVAGYNVGGHPRVFMPWRFRR